MARRGGANGAYTRSAHPRGKRRVSGARGEAARSLARSSRRAATLTRLYAFAAPSHFLTALKDMPARFSTFAASSNLSFEEPNLRVGAEAREEDERRRATLGPRELRAPTTADAHAHQATALLQNRIGLGDQRLALALERHFEEDALAQQQRQRRQQQRQPRWVLLLLYPKARVVNLYTVCSCPAAISRWRAGL